MVRPQLPATVCAAFAMNELCKSSGQVLAHNVLFDEDWRDWPDRDAAANIVLTSSRLELDASGLWIRDSD